MLEIPDSFFSISYSGAHYPGVKGVGKMPQRGNCQVFAYALLKHFGLRVPDFRSSDLWTDRKFTEMVTNPYPLDLMLWNKTQTPWGAHVGVYLGEGRAIHLSKKIGVPVIWALNTFLQQPEYPIYIGAKRVKR